MRSSNGFDLCSLDEIKAQKWAEIKSQRDQLSLAALSLRAIYDSNQVSQGRIMGAASSGIDQAWTLADNTAAELSASQRTARLYAALQAHIASVHERGRIAKTVNLSMLKQESKSKQSNSERLRVLFLLPK